MSETLPERGEAWLPRRQGRAGRRDRGSSQATRGRVIGLVAQHVAAGCWRTCRRWPRITQLYHMLLYHHLLPHATLGSLPATFPAVRSAAPSPLRSGQGLVAQLLSSPTQQATLAHLTEQARSRLVSAVGKDPGRDSFRAPHPKTHPRSSPGRPGAVSAALPGLADIASLVAPPAQHLWPQGAAGTCRRGSWNPG